MFVPHHVCMDSNDVSARLAALQARRQPAPATRTNPMTGRPRKHHPAHKARIATGAMSVVAMFGITGYMAAHDASAAAASAGASVSVTPATSATSTTKTVTAATPTAATTKAATTTNGS
jgi:hypothetical protein